MSLTEAYRKIKALGIEMRAQNTDKIKIIQTANYMQQ